MQVTLFGEVDEDEKVIQKYGIHKYHKRGTKAFQDAVNHYKYVEEHNKRVEKTRECCYNNNTESFEELEKRVAKEYGRRHIGYPCDIAQDMQIDDRPEHIKGCPECKELIRKYDVIAYGNKSN
jgi:hypothetical protein